MVEWTPITTDTLSVLGYKLYADTGHMDSFHLIFDGSQQISTTSFSFTKYANNNIPLDSELFYRFKVIGVNYNGAGVESAISLLQVCTTPWGLEPPVIVTVSSSVVELVWSAPVKNGGCAITSYHLYGDQGTASTFIELSPSSISNKPFLSSHSLDVSSFTAGTRHKLQLGV